MLITEVVSTPLDEIKMSPTNLSKLASGINSLAGMEFEMYVPGVIEPDVEPEPDYSGDVVADDIGEVLDFFRGGDNSVYAIRRLEQYLSEEFGEYATDQVYDEWHSERQDYVETYVDEHINDQEIRDHIGIPKDKEVTSEHREEYISDVIQDELYFYDDIKQQFFDDHIDRVSETDFFRERYPYMSDIEVAFGVTWPFWTGGTTGDEEQMKIEDVAAGFKSQLTNRSVRFSSSAHAIDRQPNTYIIEPDSSLSSPKSENDAGLEFVSPALPLSEILSDLEKVRLFAYRFDCYTNRTCGLHINVSVPGLSPDTIDYVKLVTLLGDEYVLNQFGRINNTYCKSSLKTIKDKIASNPNIVAPMLANLRNTLNSTASKLIHSSETSKFVSVNFKQNYVEFRSAGGNWLDDIKTNKIQNTLYRYVVALDASTKPELYRQEYLKKLYKLLDVTTSENDPTAYFAKYVAGLINKETLKTILTGRAFTRSFSKYQHDGNL